MLDREKTRQALGVINQHGVWSGTPDSIRRVLDVARAFVEGALIDAGLFTEQQRGVMGQNDDGTPNGEDYVESRWVSNWQVLGENR